MSVPVLLNLGTYKGSGHDAKGDNLVFEAKLVNVWHKQPDGSWKIAVGIWNTNQPSTSPAPVIKE